jgi:hypothetical protein
MKINFKNMAQFSSAKTTVKAPSFDRISPQTHHKTPRSARTFSQKPLQKPHSTSREKMRAQIEI